MALLLAATCAVTAAALEGSGVTTKFSLSKRRMTQLYLRQGVKLGVN